MAEWERLERAYRLLVEVGHALLRSSGEAELAQEICRGAVDVAGYRLAWVGYLDQTPPYGVRSVAYHGHDEGYLAKADIHWRGGERGEGPTGRAARTGTIQVAQNIATAVEFAPWRADATARGYGSSAAVPLIEGGTTWGVLNVYAPEPDAFGDRELEVLGTVAADLTHGILAARGRHELARLQSSLSKRAKLRGLARSAAAYAHDMNNHLLVVEMCLELLAAGDAAATDEVVSDAMVAVERAVRTNRALLNHTRGREEEESVFATDEAIEGLGSELSRLIGADIRLELDLGAEGARVRLPVGAFESMVFNLASNARDAMPGGGTLAIATRILRLEHPLPARWLGSQPGSYVAIRVSDTGSGIPAELCERVFEPFFTTKGEAGTGIGLATVYDVVVNHSHGAVAVDSEPNAGTTFELLLPLHQDASEQPS